MRTKFSGILTLILAFVVHLTFAQEKTISGNITDQDGLPLPGVNILVQGTANGTQSDFDGNYTIKGNVGETLLFSYLGQKDASRVIGGTNTINIQMEEDSQALEEVIVVGYSSFRKSEVTGSVVKLNSETISEVITPTVDQALQGNVSGLTVSANSGTPGSTSQIRIRGISSITAGNEPLYVIDGVPINNDNVSSSTASSFMSSLTGLDNNNIESITVLKDASATSQYGARGANGVILITTKTGRSGKTNFTFSSSYGFQNDAVDGPTPLTAAQRLELTAEAYFNDGVYSTVAAAESALLASPTYSDWDAAGRPEGNWADAVANDDAVIQQHSLSASGGGETHTFFASLGYMNQEATVIGSDFERVTGAINLTKNLTPKLKFSSNNSAAYSEQNAYLERSAYFESPRSAKFFLSPLVQPYNEDGTLNEFGGSLPNPLILVRDNINVNKFTRIVTNNALTWDIGNGFSVGTRVNVDYQIFNRQTYSNRNYGYGAPTQGDAGQYSRNNVFYVFQNHIDYNLGLGENHNLDFKVVQEFQKNRRYFLGAEGENFADDGLTNLDSTGKPTNVISSFTDWSVAAYLATVHYSGFDAKYVVDLSYRREGSSRFHADNRWGNFWSVGAGWNIHKESFLSDVSFINNLKLRTAYGVTGNADIDLNDYQAKFGFDDSYGGEGAQKVSSFGNNDLSWEISSTFDIGLDFGLFDNVFTGSIGYFARESKDLLLNVPLSQTTGFTTQVQNIGALTNRGIEVDFNFNIVRSDDFNLSLGGNVSTVENEVTELALDPNGIERTITTSTTRIESGHPVRGWYMPTWAGVNPTTGVEEFFVNGVDGTTTDNYNDAEAVWQGDSALPKLTAGLNIHIDYKGFFLDANGYYAGGHKIYEGWHRYLNQSNAYPILAFQGYNTLMDRWQQPGDTGVRNGKFSTSFTPWEQNSKYLTDGDFIRLRSFTLGHNFKNKFEKFGIANLQIYVRGNNLLTWVKDDNLLYDPEVDLGGQTGLETPSAKSISFGLTLNF